jgi:hypothetical protein
VSVCSPTLTLPSNALTLPSGSKGISFLFTWLHVYRNAITSTLTIEVHFFAKSASSFKHTRCKTPVDSHIAKLKNKCPFSHQEGI